MFQRFVDAIVAVHLAVYDPDFVGGRWFDLDEAEAVAAGWSTHGSPSQTFLQPFTPIPLRAVALATRVVTRRTTSTNHHTH